MLKHLYLKIRSFADGDEGATALEYGILVAMIALIIIGGVTAFGGALDGFFRGFVARVPF